MSKPISRIAHLADIHIRKSPSRHEEYREVFKELYKSLKKQKPDRIVIVGDLFHDYIDLQGEAIILAAEFLSELSKIAPVRITRGNHDIRRRNLNRVDSVEAVVKTLNNPNIVYYNSTGFFDDENITWAVWHHGEKNNNPWKKKKQIEKIPEGNITIDLFHDPIRGSRSDNGFEFTSTSYITPEDLKGDICMAGDIHLQQFLDEEQTKFYSGSLIAQKFSEGDDCFHGYLLWDLENGEVDEITVKNNWSFKNVTVNRFTDFDDLNIEIENPTKQMRIRVIWDTLPEIRKKDNERKVVDFIKNKYNPVSITHQNEFYEEDTIDIQENLNIENLTSQDTQHKIFKEYLIKIGVEEDIIDEIIKLDDEIASRLEIEQFTNIEWDIIKFSARNFMSYEHMEVDWRDKEGLFQIIGENTAGKTTILKLITYILYNNTKETENVMKYGDQRYINNRLEVDFCEASMVISANGEYFGIRRRTDIERNKHGEIKGSPTKVSFYKLSNPDEELKDTNNVENLNDEDKEKTQIVIDRTIGTYKNFMRVAMTTSDTLNEILSNERASFIDSILYDSGLDIFDSKLKEYKIFLKEKSSQIRVNCDVESSTEKIKDLTSDISRLTNEIGLYENEHISKVLDSLKKGENYIESLRRKLYKINEDIYTLNVESVKEQIDSHESLIKEKKEKEQRLLRMASELKESYDANSLNELIEKKENHRQEEFKLKQLISEHRRDISNLENKIEITRGTIHTLKSKGTEFKNEALELKSTKNCPTCGQKLDVNHQHHIDEKINLINKKIYGLVDEIKKNEDEIPPLESKIVFIQQDIKTIETQIDDMVFSFENVLNEIGVLTNDKNEVERRKEILLEAGAIPLEIENLDLKITALKDKLNQYEASLEHIKENKRIESGLQKARTRLLELKQQENKLRDEVYVKKTQVGQSNQKINELTELIRLFKIQEREDRIRDIYMKCIHRDGIPTQLLVNYAIPKINRVLSELLTDVAFNVWLDSEELKLKLAYANRMDAVIDAISASGKERTFSSICLKFALNQINMKSKPKFVMLDEIMGKLTNDSVEEFIEVIHAITDKITRALIIEHNHELNPSYIISVTKDNNDISSLIIE